MSNQRNWQNHRRVGSGAVAVFAEKAAPKQERGDESMGRTITMVAAAYRIWCEERGFDAVTGSDAPRPEGYRDFSMVNPG